MVLADLVHAGEAMNALKAILRDPLLHFLAAGGALFGVYWGLVGHTHTTVDNKTIVVTPSKLLTFLQYQSRAFQPRYFKAKFDAMTPAARRDLVHQYVREQALYREAQKLGLSKGDYVIKRRMVEKVLFLLDDTATETFSPTQTQLREYFEKHQDRYEVAPSLTFTQVFVDSTIKRKGGAEKYAENLLRKLKANRAGFDDATAYGDRFPYGQNYVQRDPAYIENLLGAGFEQAVMKLKPSNHTWYGPIKSQFGYHLVMVTAHAPAHLPKLATVRDQVRDDLLRDTLASYRKRAVADLIKHFKVKVEGALSAPVARETAAAGTNSVADAAR